MAPFSSSSSSSEGPSGRARCSYKTATALVCICNIAAALFILQLLLSPAYFFSSATTPALGFFQRNSYLRFKVKYTEEQLRRIQEALKVRKLAEPVDLVKRIQEIRRESAAGALTDEEMEWFREEVASNLTRRLDELRAAGNETQQEHQVLEQWRKKKLKEIKMQEEKAKSEGEKAEALQEAQAAGLKHLLEVGWSSLLEDIGWAELDAVVEQGEDIPSDLEIDNGIIPGRTVPSECRAEPHTDYDGKAIRWGLTFHVESAADCCQACLDQAKAVKPGHMKCNIWVYCPQEEGCYSPDRYEHKHQECWLKQASQPRLNFKRKYAAEYRKNHPTAPVVVPWVSGVTSS